MCPDFLRERPNSSGYLFKTKTTTKNKTDLMIFITPKIIE
ncbi:MAG: hypothetical protein J7K40_00870 [candidate division Zixibacteria bacterium]|nr:hypothetical protein [candidate division Zixibacteria bacterium]